MNDGMTARLEGFRAQLEVDGVCLTSLSNARVKPRGLLAINPPVELPSELIEDRREKARFQIERPCAGVATFARNNKVKDELGNTWQVWSLEDNAANITVDFWLVKLVPGVDT